MANEKIYLPKQHVRNGVAGYKGKNIVVVGSHAAAREAQATGQAAMRPTKGTKS